MVPDEDEVARAQAEQQRRGALRRAAALVHDDRVHLAQYPPLAGCAIRWLRSSGAAAGCVCTSSFFPASSSYSRMRRAVEAMVARKSSAWPSTATRAAELGCKFASASCLGCH